MVEVDEVADRVQHREEEGGQGADLVELKVGVKGDVPGEKRYFSNE